MSERQTSLSLTILALALSLFASAAEAQQPTTPAEPEPVELPPVQVQSKPVSSDDEESLTQPSEETQAETLRSTPGGTNLINETRFKTGKASTMEDILRQQPGIIVGSRGSADEARISIRGSAVDRNFHVRGIRLLQDGIPMNQADGNGGFQWLEPLAIQSVEVSRGGNALQYGASTLGGSLNFISPTGYTAPGIQARVETGSYGYIKGQVSSGMRLGRWDYFASGAASYQNGFQDHSRNRSQRYTGNLGYRFSDNLETRFYGGFVNSKMQLPGSLTRGELFHNPRTAQSNAVDFDQQHNVIQTYAANKTTWRFKPDQTLEGGIYWINYRLDHPLFWNQFFLNGLGVIDQVSNTWGGSLRYENRHALLGHKNNLTLGVNPQFGYLRERRFENLSGRKRGMKTADGGQFATTLDLYGENRHYLLEKLAVVAGGNVSYAVRNYNDRFNRNPNGNQTRNQDYWGINPKAGLLYDLTPTSQIYANFTRSFEPPTLLEISQLDSAAGDVITRRMKAQTASTIEFGTRGSARRISWDTTFYRSWVRNELFTLNDALGNAVGTVNGKRTYHQGVEAGLSLVLAEGLLAKNAKKDNRTALSAIGPALSPKSPGGRDRLVLRQVYDWTHLRFKDDPVYGNNRLPGAPAHLYRAELLYEHPCGFYIQPNLEWSLAKYPVDYANSVNANAYALLGLRTGYRSKRGWSAFVEFRNLTNKRYASAVQVVANAGSPATTRAYSPGQGFSVYGGIELKW